VNLVGRLVALVRRSLPVAFLVVAISFVTFASGLATFESRQQYTRTIRIAAALLPPHMTEAGEGREADIIRAALKKGGVSEQVEFFVLPFTRHWNAYLRDSRFDALATAPLPMVSGDRTDRRNSVLDFNGFPSQRYVEYENGIVYRMSDFPYGLGNDPLQLLEGRRVVAFAGASAILPGLRQSVPSFSLYVERDDQYEHSSMFRQRGVDAIIADRLIIDEYNRRILGSGYADLTAELEFDPIYCPTPYRLVFRRDDLRIAFNKGLQLLTDSGELAAIDERYRAGSGLREAQRDSRPCK
jgi:polar amino acid transport system substrate-binding protein